MFDTGLGLGSKHALSLQAQAIAILRRFGTNAHVYLPGIGSISGLTAGNYLLSDGSTGLTPVDGLQGLVLDGMGSVGSELVTNGDFATDTWWSKDTGVTIGGGTCNFSIVANGLGVWRAALVPTGYSYQVSFTVGAMSAGGVKVTCGTGTSSTITTTGSFTVYVQGTGTDGFAIVAVGTTTATIDNISVKQVTGTHATSTGAARPTLRRGLYCAIPYSQDITQWSSTAAGSITSGQADPNGGTSAQLFSGAGKNVYKVVAGLAAGTPVTHAITCYSATGGTFTIGSANATAQSLITVSAGWGTYAFAWTSSLNDGPVLILNGSLTSITVYRQGFFQGTLTASQIISEGSIPLTTTAAASNSTAGRYSSQFSGAQSLALGSAIGATNEFASIFGINPTTVTTNVIYDEGVNGFRTYLNSNGSVDFNKNGVSAFAVAPVSTISTGSSAVLSCRLSSGFGTIRKNGAVTVNTASANSCAGTGAATIGAGSGGSSFQYIGSLGPVIAIKGTVTDAELLTIERFVASLTPNAPSF